MIDYFHVKRLFTVWEKDRWNVSDFCITGQRVRKIID